MEQVTKRFMNWASILEDNTRAQVQMTSEMPFIFPHVALMPDAHLGKGCAVGAVLPTLGAIMPAAVGVDIGCGMIAVRTQFLASDLPADRKPLREAIEAAIPLSTLILDQRVRLCHALGVPKKETPKTSEDPGPGRGFVMQNPRDATTSGGVDDLQRRSTWHILSSLVTPGSSLSETCAAGRNASSRLTDSLSAGLMLAMHTQSCRRPIAT